MLGKQRNLEPIQQKNQNFKPPPDNKRTINIEDLLKQLSKNATDTRKKFLNVSEPDTTSKCYHSGDILKTMLNIVSVPIHYMFTILVDNNANNDNVDNIVIEVDNVKIGTLMSLELKGIPSPDKFIVVEPPNNPFTFVFDNLLNKTKDSNKLRQTIQNETNVAKNNAEATNPLQNSLLHEKSIKDGVKSGKIGMKVSFITIQYKDNDDIAKTLVADVVVKLYNTDIDDNKSTESEDSNFGTIYNEDDDHKKKNSSFFP